MLQPAQSGTASPKVTGSVSFRKTNIVVIVVIVDVVFVSIVAGPSLFSALLRNECLARVWLVIWHLAISRW